MGKVMTAALIVLGLWVGVEIFTMGPSRAFGGLFADVFESETAPGDQRSTAQRAGAAVERAQAESEARRERLLSD